MGFGWFDTFSNGQVLHIKPTALKMADIIFKKQSHEKQDYERFYVAKPDADFSPERNKHVVENSIKKFELNRKKKNKQYLDDLGERTDAVWDYLRHLSRGKSTPIERYFGKKYLAYLRGEKIMSMLRPDKKGIVLISKD